MATDKIEPAVQHEVDDKAEKEEVLGSLGGIAVGATVGIAAGPVGAIVGAVAGGLLGAGVASAIVDAQERGSHHNTVQETQKLNDANGRANID